MQVFNKRRPCVGRARISLDPRGAREREVGVRENPRNFEDRLSSAPKSRRIDESVAIRVTGLATMRATQRFSVDDRWDSPFMSHGFRD